MFHYKFMLVLFWLNYANIRTYNNKHRIYKLIPGCSPNQSRNQIICFTDAEFELLIFGRSFFLSCLDQNRYRVNSYILCPWIDKCCWRPTSQQNIQTTDRCTTEWWITSKFLEKVEITRTRYTDIYIFIIILDLHATFRVHKIYLSYFQETFRSFTQRWHTSPPAIDLN